jgi:RimJ/RimL family protein N-acetyltransferase
VVTAIVPTVVRPSTAADFEDWFGLYESVAAEGKWIGGEAPVDRIARKRSYLETLQNEEAASFVAEVDGRLVGSLGVHMRAGIADLGMLIDVEWRGRGIGSALMEACIAWASDHGAHKVVLEVWPHNQSAQALYRKFGFEEEGRLKRHYRRRNGELWDAIRMGLVLDRSSPGCPFGGD